MRYQVSKSSHDMAPAGPQSSCVTEEAREAERSPPCHYKRCQRKHRGLCMKVGHQWVDYRKKLLQGLEVPDTRVEDLEGERILDPTHDICAGTRVWLQMDLLPNQDDRL